MNSNKKVINKKNRLSKTKRGKKDRLKQQRKDNIILPNEVKVVIKNNKIKIKYNFRTKHNSAIMYEANNIIEHFPLTHKSKTGRNSNLKLLKNPNPNDSTDSYVVKKIRKHKSKDFSKDEKHNWEFAREDEDRLKKLYENKKK